MLLEQLWHSHIRVLWYSSCREATHPRDLQRNGTYRGAESFVFCTFTCREGAAAAIQCQETSAVRSRSSCSGSTQQWHSAASRCRCPGKAWFAVAIKAAAALKHLHPVPSSLLNPLTVWYSRAVLLSAQKFWKPHCRGKLRQQGTEEELERGETPIILACLRRCARPKMVLPLQGRALAGAAQLAAQRHALVPWFRPHPSLQSPIP